MSTSLLVLRFCDVLLAMVLSEDSKTLLSQVRTVGRLVVLH